MVRMVCWDWKEKLKTIQPNLRQEDKNYVVITEMRRLNLLWFSSASGISFIVKPNFFSPHFGLWPLLLLSIHVIHTSPPLCLFCQHTTEGLFVKWTPLVFTAKKLQEKCVVPRPTIVINVTTVAYPFFFYFLEHCTISIDLASSPILGSTNH